jgi:hypothetical protein
MKQPRPEDYDHYPDRELDPKSEERRAYNNAMNRYRRWKNEIPLAIPDDTRLLSRVFDQSLGEDHCLAVEDEDSNSRVVVFYNTMEKIKKKVTEFGGPDGFRILPLIHNVNGCKAVALDERLDPCVVERCLRKLSGTLTLDEEGARIQTDLVDMWLLVL